jgi:phosphate transport system permease protein
MAHALGETAPLLLIGMISFMPGIPGGLTEPAGALPSLIYIWENASERAFHERTAAAIMVLLAFMIVMNAAAVLLRRRFERRW